MLGYEIDTDTAIDILEDRWNAPEGTDQSTLTLFKEMSHIWKLMKDGEVDIVITEEDFRHYWRRARERTASSFSRLHFGHYKAAAYSEYLSDVHSLKLSLIA